ncbi:tRNA epoxyqueuosine(34) reductase QueG [Lutimonas zeaxanthinifaciens]|uniref:tRNA epoxyqueuosine(34) reductase QueG n=1 Tax=Lutimonas zeaxanthinifaciens TaxID=3060215 RepID=UPI00265D11FB|nr:tRNA epoxyqueuosine(34) reductase QueG [Lutimonas sp. YSD2104]WKK65426.1 tRNA epoxyqueuosine(34) reductase QueG [Lutimonas sp. YSD2104]
MIQKKKYSRILKLEAKKLGFEACGISRAGFLSEDAPRLEQWLKQGYHGQMGYMENHFEKRLDPTKLVPGAKSVISLLYNYFPLEIQNKDSYQIAKYAYGEDYHQVIRNRLKSLVTILQSSIGEFNARVFTDSAPVMERTWAQKSGLGWLGKHSLLISKQKGSYFFLAEIITDLEFDYDPPFAADHCGSCTRCIDACPTDAILPNNTIDASKCISYFTIELKDEIPEAYKNKFEDWAFGCDICQDVCPWNRFSKPNHEEKFQPDPRLLSNSKSDWEEITEEVFREIFKRSAVKRTKFKGFQRNIRFLKK